MKHRNSLSVRHKSHVGSVEEQAAKRFMMWAGVSACMLVVIGVWSLSLSDVLHTKPEKETVAVLPEVTNSIASYVSNVKDELSKRKTAAQAAAIIAAKTATTNQASAAATIDVETLKQNVLNAAPKEPKHLP